MSDKFIFFLSGAMTGASYHPYTGPNAEYFKIFKAILTAFFLLFNDTERLEIRIPSTAGFIFGLLAVAALNDQAINQNEASELSVFSITSSGF